MKMSRTTRMKSSTTRRGRTCTGGGSVREEGRAAARAAAARAHWDVFIESLAGRWRARGRRVRRFALTSLVSRSARRRHVSPCGRCAAAVRAAVGESRPQEFTGAGGRPGEDPQREVLVQVSHPAHDPAHRRLQAPPGTQPSPSPARSQRSAAPPLGTRLIRDHPL